MMADNSTVLLIQPPIRDFYFTRKRSIPYGIACIAQALRSKGFHVILLDALATTKTRKRTLPSDMMYLEPFYGRLDTSPFSLFHGFKHYGLGFESIGIAAKESGAFLVGISSLFTAYSDEAMETARAVKRHHPSCKVVLGGHHPTHMAGEVLSNPSVDFVIRGEGENAMTELALSLKEHTSFDNIRGLAFKTDKGKVHINPKAYIENPEEFFFPAMDLMDNEFYGRKEGASAVVTTSRGCPMTCSYCSVASPASRYRRRSVESVYQEISDAVLNHGARFIDFEDENLTLDKSWCMDLFSRISENFGHFPIELRAMNGLYPPSLDDDIIAAMYKAGFRALNLSLCSLSKDQLKRFGRKDVRETYENALHSLNQRGMESVTYILVGAPGEDPFESLADLVYLAGKDTLAGVSVYYPAPGSRDYATMSDKGGLPSRFALMRSTAIPVSDTTSRLQSLTLLRLGRIVNFTKELKKKGIPVFASPLDDRADFLSGDRTDNGLALLRAFFHDGRIRGIDQKGAVYDHVVSQDLCEEFVSVTRHILWEGPISQK